MPTTKSGIETPTDPPKKPIDAPVKHYPGSGNIGKGGGSPSISSPCDTYKRK